MSLGTQVASLFGVLALDDSDFQRGAKSASGTMKDLGQGMQSLGGNLTVLGAPFLALGAVAENAFDTMDDAADQLGAVIKSTGGAAGVTQQAALLLGAQLQELSGINRANIVSGEAMLLTFTNIGHDVFPRTTKAALDLSVAMKQDMKSSAIQLGKALNDPITGITALTRVGVTFSKTQKDMIQTMVDAGNVAGAQGIILTEIEKEFGGSAAAAADPIDHLRATLNDLAIDIGVALQPVLEAVIPVVQDFAKHISEFLTTMSDNGDNTVGIILAIGAGLAIIGPIIAVIGSGIAAIGGLLAVVLSPIGLIIAAVVGLYLAFQNNFLGIRDLLQPVVDAISNFFAHFADNIKLYGSLALLYFEYYITNPFSSFWNDKVKPAFDAFLGWFTTTGIPFIQTAISDFQTNFLNPIIRILTEIWNDVSGGLIKLGEWFFAPDGGLAQAGKSLSDFKTNTIDPFINALKDIWNKAQPALEAFKNGIAPIFAWVHDHVIQPINDILDSLITKLHELTGNTVIQQAPGTSQFAQYYGQGLYVPQGGSQPGIGSPNTYNPAPIPPVGGGSGAAPGNQGVNIGTLHITANSVAEGQAAMNGALNAARNQGH